MRYIYYIIIIFVISTIGAGWGIFPKTKVELSKPALVVNNKIITEQELEQLLKLKSSYQTKEYLIDSLIVKELLIQEAIKQKINKDESFRVSVEDFYEQSLVKILMDDQFKLYDPIVTDHEINNYKTLSQKRIFLSKLIYASKDDIEANKSIHVKIIESDFFDLSETLRFLVFNLQPGESSRAIKTIEGFVVYNLIKTETIKESEFVEQVENEKISEFLKNGKKEAHLVDWVDGLREKAEIWRQK